MGNVLTDYGPVVLVPAAWTVAGAATLGTVDETPLLIAHGVMAVLLVAFAAAAWDEMSDGVLRVWRSVLVAGIPITLAGAVGLGAGVGGPVRTALLAVSFYGWAVAPAVGLAYTGRLSGVPSYSVGTALCIVGAGVHAAAPVIAGATGYASSAAVLIGVIAIGAGQTVGIMDAAYRY